MPVLVVAIATFEVCRQVPICTHSSSERRVQDWSSTVKAAAVTGPTGDVLWAQRHLAPEEPPPQVRVRVW